MKIETDGVSLKDLDWAIDVLEKVRKSNDRIGMWLSAALDDPNVCDDMKNDIREWMDAVKEL